MQRLREVLLWAGAALGLLAIAAGLAVTFFGFSFLIFRSGSMEPEIQTGAIALSRAVQAEQIRPGDVVSVVAANGDRITHRVVSSTVRGDETALVLKGDANATEDSEIYVVTRAERVVASVPFGGYVLAHALTPPGLVALACLSMIFFLLGSSRDADESDDDSDDGSDDDAPDHDANGEDGPAPRSSRHRADVPKRQVLTGGLVALMVVGAAGAALGTGGTLATFTDPARAATGTLGAASIAVPATPVISTSSTTSVTFTWSPATPVGSTTASRYEVVRYASLEATTGTVACSVPAPTLTCTDSAPVAGTSYYGLRARIGGNWFSDSANRVSYISDVTGPSLTFRRPLDNASSSASQMRSLVAGCDPVGIACGNAADPSGVRSVEYTLRRTGFLSAGVCWTGTGWAQAATCTFNPATGTTAWAVPGSANTAYGSNLGGLASYNFVLTVRVTDAADNVTTDQISYQIS